MNEQKMPPGGDDAPTGRNECDQRDADHVPLISPQAAGCKQISLREQAEGIMCKHSLNPIGPLVVDGALHHADVEGDRPGSGHIWYVVKSCPNPILIFGDFKHRLKEDKVVHELRSDGPPPTAAEQEAWKVAREAARRAVEDEQRKAAQALRAEFSASQNATSANAYLVRKQVSPCAGLKTDSDGRLIVPTYDSETSQLISTQVVEANGGKRFALGCRTKGGVFVIGGENGGARVPENAEKIFLVEGIATGLSLYEAMGGAPVVVCFSAGNLMPVANNLARTLPRKPRKEGGRLKATICMCADNDRRTEAKNESNTGLEAGRHVAKRHGFHFASPEFSLAGDGSDFNDLFIEQLEIAARRTAGEVSTGDHRSAALAQVHQQIQVAIDGKPLCFTEEEAIEHLRGLAVETEREREREEIAAAMEIKTSWLKKAESEARKERLKQRAEQGENDKDQPFMQVKPHGEHVDGASVLEEAVTFLKRHVSLSAHLADLAAVWSLGTHCVEEFEHYARAYITSNSENSGKTTLGEVMVHFSARGFSTTSPSRAALLRDLGERPTVLLDEAENWLHLDEIFCAILNEGFRRDGNLRRCVETADETGAKSFVVKSFPVFAPVVIAGIGGLPRPSLTSRCLQFYLTPAPHSHQPAAFDGEARKAATSIAGKFARWVADNREHVRSAIIHPETTLGTNRQRQIAKPLLAIAQVVGGGWPELVKLALEKLWECDLPDPGLPMRLMLAVLDVFTSPDPSTGKTPMDRTAPEMADSLLALSDYAWGRARRGDPIDAEWVRTNLRREFRLNVRRRRRQKLLVYAYVREDILRVVEIYRDRLREVALLLCLGAEGTLQVLGLDCPPAAEQSPNNPANQPNSAK